MAEGGDVSTNGGGHSERRNDSIRSHHLISSLNHHQHQTQSTSVNGSNQTTLTVTFVNSVPPDGEGQSKIVGNGLGSVSHNNTNSGVDDAQANEPLLLDSSSSSRTVKHKATLPHQSSSSQSTSSSTDHHSSPPSFNKKERRRFRKLRLTSSFRKAKPSSTVIVCTTADNGNNDNHQAHPRDPINALTPPPTPTPSAPTPVDAPTRNGYDSSSRPHNAEPATVVRPAALSTDCSVDLSYDEASNTSPPPLVAHHQIIARQGNSRTTFLCWTNSFFLYEMFDSHPSPSRWSEYKLCPTDPDRATFRTPFPVPNHTDRSKSHTHTPSPEQSK